MDSLTKAQKDEYVTSYAALALYAQKLGPQAADPALSRFCCADATADWPHLTAQSPRGRFGEWSC